MEVTSRDTRITELERRLKETEHSLLKAEEGHAVAESDVSLSKEAEEAALDSLQRESAKVASLEVALAHAKAILDDPEFLESYFRGSDNFCALEQDLQRTRS